MRSEASTSRGELHDAPLAEITGLESVDCSRCQSLEGKRLKRDGPQEVLGTSLPAARALSTSEWRTICTSVSRSVGVARSRAFPAITNAIAWCTGKASTTFSWRA